MFLKIDVNNLKLKDKPFMAYAIYGILLTAWFLYLFFPADAFRDYLETTVSREYPGLDLSVEEMRLAPPLGVRFLQARLSMKANPAVRVFIAESLSIRPAIGSFLRGNRGYVFRCKAYGGHLNGNFHQAKNGTEHLFSAVLQLSGIDIEKLQGLLSLLGQKASGTLEGAITYRGLTDGTGEAHLKISDGDVKLHKSIFGLNTINFDNVAVNVSLKQKTVEISHAEITGPEVQGTLTGSIGLKKNILESILNLKGTIKILNALFQNKQDNNGAAALFNEPIMLPFSIRGTIKEPNLLITQARRKHSTAGA